ncbi:MAG: HYR domain-containing protein [Acidobacteriia bacterium]|nr:HYR domain-containing protein [Terriglobia bacterium]
MLRSFAVRVLLALALLPASPAAAQVTAWDAARDFSAAQNPNGQWTYGWKASPSASLISFPTYEQTLVAYPGRDAWQDLSRSNLLGVYHNAVGVTGDIPAGMLMLQPDPLGELAIAEWTAPADMSLHVQGMFQSLATADSQVTVVSSVSGTRFSGTVNSTTTTSAFGLFLNVAAGEKIDFVASGGAAGVNVVVSTLSVVGNATIQSIALADTRLRVTSNAQGQVGGAWTFTKQRFGDGFDTTFLFQISQLTNVGADGFAFVIQNSSTTALSASGGSLGYDGIPASLVIEFDTFQNTQPGWNDPNSNHISVHTLGINPNSAMGTAAIGSTTSIPNLKDGKWHLMHMHYAVQPQPQLSLYLDNVATPVLQVGVNIVSQLQLSDGAAWVGFTGATGGYTEVHDIQNWHFLSYDLHTPVLTLPANMTVEGNILGGATMTFTASAADVVDGPRPATCTPASGSVFPVGDSEVQCSSTDLSGNTANESFVVTVTDTTPPTVVVPLTVSASAPDRSGAPVSYVATASDIVDGAIVPACSPASGNAFPLGTTPVTCSATDHAGNSASQNFSVNVTDQTPPVISGLADLRLEAAGPFTTVSWPGVSATDNVDETVPVVCTPASGSQFAVGSTTVQCSASDAAGNRLSGSFVVTLQDTTPSAITGMPPNMTVEATTATGAVVSWPAPTATDLVDGPVPVTCVPASGSTFALGPTVVTCSATDARGNAANKAFKVTVQDTTPPAITGVPANLTLEATGPSGAVAAWSLPTAADLVDGPALVTCAPASGSTFPLGSTTVVCSAADTHGNKSTRSFSVTVQATTPPVISCGKPDGLWHAADVAIACTARSNGPGLANAADASFVLTTSVPAGTETASAATNSHTVCDLAGKCVIAGPSVGNSVDKRAPAITIAAPAKAAYALHQPVPASYACADGGSGVAACNGPVANRARLDTASAGAKQFTVHASDNVGNASSSSVSYSVGYKLCLLDRLQPKPSGSTIPVRLELCDYAGHNVSSPALVVVAAGVVDANGAAMLLQAAGNDNPGLHFRYIGARTFGAYGFELKTKGLAPGIYRLLVRVGGDSTLYPVTFLIGHSNHRNRDRDRDHDRNGDHDGDRDDGHRRR